MGQSYLSQPRERHGKAVERSRCARVCARHVSACGFSKCGLPLRGVKLAAEPKIFGSRTHTIGVIARTGTQAGKSNRAGRVTAGDLRGSQSWRVSMVEAIHAFAIESAFRLKMCWRCGFLPRLAWLCVGGCARCSLWAADCLWLRCEAFGPLHRHTCSGHHTQYSLSSLITAATNTEHGVRTHASADSGDTTG